MRLYLFYIFLFLASTTQAQNNLTPIEAKQIITTFFEGFHKADTLIMQRVMHNDMVLQTAYTNNNGDYLVENTGIKVFLQTIANRKQNQVWEEKLLDYKIQIDGNLAHVWTPYEFWYNGNFSHCGANSFTLVKTESGWKILHLIDSRRRAGCKD